MAVCAIKTAISDAHAAAFRFEHQQPMFGGKTGLNGTFHRQATNKVVDPGDAAAALPRTCF